MLCYLYPEPLYLLFAEGVPELLYYSHIPGTVIALLVGLFVFFNGRHNLLNKLLLLISICFALWICVNLIAWTNIHSDVLLFVWSFYGVLQGLISILCVYFIYVFLDKSDVTFRIKLIFLALLAPIFLLAPSDANVGGFNLAWCDAFEFEGQLYKTYYTLLGVVAMAWIGYLLTDRYLKADPQFKKQIIYMGIGIEFFLFSFFTALYIATQLATLGIVSDSRLEMYGLFGMTVFMVFIGILMVKFKTFSVGLVASNALVIALLILVGSQFTFVESSYGIVLTFVTLILTGLIGNLLIRSVRNEITQRRQIEKLAQDLQKANERLKILDKMKTEFVSIASHQLRSPLTSIRGYASMLLEGSYGKLSQKATEAVERIGDSSRYMALSVEDYLNVSRIEAGNMKYELSDFNLKELTEKIVDEMRPAALKKGLLMLFRSDCDAGCYINADIGKVRQVIMNLIDNSMKYTPKGSITVIVHDDPKKKKLYVTIKDTGVGMSKDTLEDVFDKFVRAKNANQVNVTGTGLGLFVAKKMVDEMGGKIWAESDGEGKGTALNVEFKLLTSYKNCG